MTLRLILLALLFTACNNADSAEQTAGEQSAETHNDATQRLQFETAVASEVANTLVSNLSKAVTLSQEQVAQINEFLNTQNLDDIRNPGDVRKKVREYIVTEVLSPTQYAEWQAYLSKRNRAPVVIE